MTTMRGFTKEEAASFAAVRARLLGGGGHTSKAYYASAAFAVQPVAAEGLGTWACDKNWRLYVDPQHLPGGEAGWDVAACADVFEHELNHLLRAHAERMIIHAGAAHDAERGNIATDLEINDDFDPSTFVAQIGVTPQKMQLPPNKTAEWYYDNLPSNSSPQGEGGQGQGGSGQGLPRCGSGSGGAPIDGELDEDSDVAPSVGAGKATVVRGSVAQAVKEHEQRHGQGTVAGGLSEWASITLAPPTVPWQRVLAAEVRRGVRYAAGHQDHTYTRISRRSHSLPGVALPAMHSPKPRIAAVVDTSGSMSMEMIEEALNEVRGIAAAAGCVGDDLMLIQVDADVAEVRPFSDARKLVIHGRGGTDMRVGIEAALAGRHQPTVVVVLTDGFTPWPSERPRKATVVAAIIGDQEWRDRSVAEAKSQMPWARVVAVGA